ncbi:hypothetical protein IOQ59_00250 [Pontibacterium sp. N1Y112]|uniref:HTH luxR-type domain-containing protein n=1 Tax=Pontibacterium sinense TaxID=2781979 RepID=A0A8J7F7P1_9GAMM|nr:hypothetical protein [Pontibacterium sinense]MBE9395687.1 hypothetical protein [Pontibacterium sinense]
MLDQKQIEILDQLYKCILKPDHWGDLMERINDDLNANGTNVFVGDRIFQELHNSWITTDMQTTFQGFMENGFVKYELPLGETLSRITPSPQFRLMPEIETEHNKLSEHKMDNGFIHDWLYQHHQIRHRYLSPLNHHPTHFDSICVSFQDRPEVEIERGIQRGNFYLPHIANLINVSRPFMLLQARFNGVLEVLDRLRLGVFLLSFDGESIEKNSAAENVLDQQDALFLDGKQILRFSDPDTQTGFTQAMAQLSAFEGGDVAQAKQRFLVPRASGKRNYLIELSPLLHDDMPLGVLMIVADPDEKTLVDTAHFGDLFGLTEAEQTVCQLLVEGHKAGDIADIRSTRVDTVRGQVKSILTKTETFQQTELIRLALSINIPVD